MAGPSRCLDYSFKGRREQIAKKRFNSRRCFGYRCVELQMSECCEVEGEVEEEGRSIFKRGLGDNYSKVGSCNCDAKDLLSAGVSVYSYDEVEALNELIEEESQVVAEVLRIKEVLNNKQEELDEPLFESLRRLQLMQLSAEVLKATEIGSTVNGLQKNTSKQIQNLVRSLVDGWKSTEDEWDKATDCLNVPSAYSPDSVIPSVVDEGGLPCPPMDEGALLAIQTNTFRLSEIFDGIDDDDGSMPTCHISRVQRKPSITPTKMQESQLSAQDYTARLEKSKRKLQEGYRQVEKRQRKVQLMELHDLPKQSNPKPAIKSRNRAVSTNA